MGWIRTFLIAGSIIASATPALADGMSVRVCNRGELTVSTAVAYEDSDLASSYWVAVGWFTIAPNTCSVVYRDGTVCDGGVHFRPCARVRLAYRFTDSTGVKGTAEVGDSRFPPGNETMCVTGTGTFKERRSAPSGACDRPGRFLVPAAVAIDTFRGDPERTVYSEHFVGTTLNVALSSRDRARPFPGAEGNARSQSPPQSAPGRIDPAQLARLAALAAFLDDALRGPGAPGMRIKFNGGDAIANVSLTTCVAQPILQRVPWSDRNAARASAAKAAIRQFVSSHWFREAASAETRASPPFVNRTIRLSETGNAFDVHEVRECSNESSSDTQVPVAGRPQASRAPSTKPPAAKAPSTSDGGFGDLMGPGGFIKPPPK